VGRPVLLGQFAFGRSPWAGGVQLDMVLAVRVCNIRCFRLFVGFLWDVFYQHFAVRCWE